MGAKDSKRTCLGYDDAVKRSEYSPFTIHDDWQRNKQQSRFVFFSFCIACIYSAGARVVHYLITSCAYKPSRFNARFRLFSLVSVLCIRAARRGHTFPHFGCLRARTTPMSQFVYLLFFLLRLFTRACAILNLFAFSSLSR